MNTPLLAIAAFLLAPVAAAFAAAKPNIILVMPDDVGYGDYAALGNPLIRTPSVDTFKQESLLFTPFHVSPTCAPTRSALMSGRHEFKNGVTHTILERERMALSTYTLPQLLKTVGYTSGIFGKWHLGDEAAYQPDRRGFDEVYIHGGGGIGQIFPGSCGDAPGITREWVSRRGGRCPWPSGSQARGCAGGLRSGRRRSGRGRSGGFRRRSL